MSAQNKARGPFFIVPSKEMPMQWIEKGIRQSPYSNQGMTDSEKQIFLALVRHAPSTEEQPITMTEMVEVLRELKPKAHEATLENQVRRIAASLSEMMIFKRDHKALLGARKQSCYTLRNPEDVLTKLEEISAKAEMKKPQDERRILPRERQKAMASVRANLLTRDDIIYPVVDFNPAEPWTILMITQLMERCSREHPRDPRKTIEAKVTIGQDTADVIAHTTTRNDEDVNGDVGLLTAGDAQTVMAIITLASQYIERAQEEGRPVVNKIPLDVLDLCTLLGKKREGGAREGVVRSLMRVLYTTFTIKLKPGSNAAQRLTGAEGGIGAETDFRLIKSHVIGIEGASKKQKDETAYARRWFTLSLNDSVWQSLVTGRNTRLVHPGLLQETNGYMQKLYAHLKLHTPIDGQIIRTTAELYSYFGYKAGMMYFKEFLRKKLLERGGLDPDMEIPDTGITIDFFGYEITIRNDDFGEGKLVLIAKLSPEEKRRLNVEKQKLRKREIAGQLGLPLEQDLDGHLLQSITK